MFGFFKRGEKKAEGGAYTPPEMPPFPTDYNGVVRALAPYYKAQRPLDFFFEMYVCDVLEQLPTATKEALKTFSEKHPTFFASHGGDWRRYVVEQSHLSDTIEVAIWDLWIHNSSVAERDGWTCHPWHFAQLFSENYFADGSRVDVWEGSALQDAKDRIATYRKKG